MCKPLLADVIGAEEVLKSIDSSNAALGILLEKLGRLRSPEHMITTACYPLCATIRSINLSTMTFRSQLCNTVRQPDGNGAPLLARLSQYTTSVWKCWVYWISRAILSGRCALLVTPTKHRSGLHQLTLRGAYKSMCPDVRPSPYVSPPA